MGLFGFGSSKESGGSKEYKRQIAQAKKREAAEKKRERAEKKRQREIEHLKKGTELYSARAKFRRAKHAAAHPIAVRKHRKTSHRPRKRKGSLRIF